MNDLLLAISLGDCHVRKHGQIDIVHSSKQEEYIKWKYDMLAPYIPVNRITTFTNNGFPGLKLTSGPSKEMAKIREMLYADGVKTYSDEVVSKMTPLCWALLYLDDGSLISRKNKEHTKITAHEIIISICSDEEAECQRLIDELSKSYGIKFTIKRNYKSSRNKTYYSIRCGLKMLECLLT